MSHMTIDCFPIADRKLFMEETIRICKKSTASAISKMRLVMALESELSITISPSKRI